MNEYQQAKLKKMNTTDYTYSVLLETFRTYSGDIKQSLFGKSFKSWNDKFNYICKVAENHFIDTKKRLDNEEKSRELIQQLDINSMFNEGASYQRRTKATSDRLKGLW